MEKPKKRVKKTKSKHPKVDRSSPLQPAFRKGKRRKAMGI